MSLLGSAGRAEGMSALFRAVEKRFGNLESLREPASVGVITADELRREDLEALFEHRAAAVHVKGFYPAAAAAALAARLELMETTNWEISSGRGLESSDVTSISVPFNVALGKGPEAVEAYFAAARALQRRLRAPPAPGAPPLLPPIDQLRLELDELWPHGARAARDARGRAFLPGLPRIMRGPTRSLAGFVHVDDLAPLRAARGLFSANAYLRMPPAGGALAVYPLAVRTRWDFYRHAATLSGLMGQGAAAQDALRRALPPPLRVRPAPGDLVLLCAQRPHAAEGFPVGTRVSMQSFVTHERGQALTLDT
ncbi:hypothetical protein JKP88DRAFT_177784 [Tribonema minus]|uniref:Uncharacterized protein n=1 Tax=Tribonema minus TaxID=303371 RepID=A0A836CMD3_9STRA|nr:hypothetical protein JKP88DRAFT_177784 [Tribonema minus]